MYPYAKPIYLWVHYCLVTNTTTKTVPAKACADCGQTRNTRVLPLPPGAPWREATGEVRLCAPCHRARTTGGGSFRLCGGTREVA